MTIVRTQAILQRDSGLPEDVVVNTFHHSVAGAPPTSLQLDDIEDQVRDFYNVAPAGFNAVGVFLSSHLQNTLRLKMYNMDLPPPRNPLRDTTGPLVAPNAGTNLPSEVAAVLSYRGQPTPGIDPKSNRGRIYIGPLNSTAVFDSTFDIRVSPIGQFSAAGARMKAAGATSLATWVVFSPTRRARLLSPDFVPVASGYCDDALDTQRRRGRAPSTRNVFT